MGEASALCRRSRHEDIELKNTSHVSEQLAPPDVGSSFNDAEVYNPIQGDTQHDIRDMQRLGKKQEYKRNFDFLSTLGFVSIYCCR